MKGLTVLLLAVLLTACGQRAEESSEKTLTQTKTSAVTTTAVTTAPPESIPDESITDEQEEQMSWTLFEELYPKLDDKDRSFRNYAHNSQVGIDGYIEYGQANEPVSELILGDVSFSGVGCEVVAAYNYLLYTGNERDIAKLTFDFEKNGLYAPSGRLGSNPRKIRGLFNALGISYERYLDPADCVKALDAGKPIILSFHTGNSIFSEVHTVFIMTENGQHYVFNRYNESKERYPFDTLYDIIKKDELFIVAYTPTDRGADIDL